MYRFWVCKSGLRIGCMGIDLLLLMCWCTFFAGANIHSQKQMTVTESGRPLGYAEGFRFHPLQAKRDGRAPGT